MVTAWARGLSGKPTLASVTLSFLRVQWVGEKMTFFSPVPKGQWKVIGGTARTQVDVKQTQRFAQVLGKKRAWSKSYLREPLGAVEH